MQEIGNYPRIKSIYGDGILGEGWGQVSCLGDHGAVKSGHRPAARADFTAMLVKPV